MRQRVVRRRTCRLALAVAAALCMTAPAGGQDEETFRARLAPSAGGTGAGEVRAVLRGRLLDISGRFDGLTSVATAAHVHQAPAGETGPALFTLEVTPGRDGDLRGGADLAGDQVEALREGTLYVQIHTLDRPAGALLGWLGSVW